VGCYRVEEIFSDHKNIRKGLKVKGDQQEEFRGFFERRRRRQAALKNGLRIHSVLVE